MFKCPCHFRNQNDAGDRGPDDGSEKSGHSKDNKVDDVILTDACKSCDGGSIDGTNVGTKDQEREEDASRCSGAKADCRKQKLSKEKKHHRPDQEMAALQACNHGMASCEYGRKAVAQHTRY